MNQWFPLDLIKDNLGLLNTLPFSNLLLDILSDIFSVAILPVKEIKKYNNTISNRKNKIYMF